MLKCVSCPFLASMLAMYPYLPGVLKVQATAFLSLLSLLSNPKEKYILKLSPFISPSFVLHKQEVTLQINHFGKAVFSPARHKQMLKAQM